MSAKRDLKAFVRLDNSNRVVPGSLIFRKHKPKEGRFMEIVIDPCCGPGISALWVENTSPDAELVVNGVVIPAENSKIILPKLGLKLFNLEVTVVGADVVYDWEDSTGTVVGISGGIADGNTTTIAIDQTLGIVKLQVNTAP